MAGIQVPGLGSNLDVGGLVSQLMAVERQPLAKLDQKEAAVQVKVSAYGTFRGAVSTLRASLAGLQNAPSYSAVKATITDSAVASVSAAANADLGTHTLEVTELAVANRLKSGTFANLTDVVGTGTLTIQYGKYNGTTSFTPGSGAPTHNIVIDTKNNTLAGVRDAINKANVGVTASIVNDGTGYRLVTAAKNTGTDNALRISVTDGDSGNSDASGLSRLAYDATAAVGSGKNQEEVTAAKDSKFLLDGIAMVKSGNTVGDALFGTTINLLKTNAGAPTTFNVAKDTTKIKTSIDEFVKAYNELDSTVDKLTAFDKATNTAGELNGDAAVRQISGRIRDTLSHVISGAPQGYAALSQVGITLNREGQLTVNASKLQAALDADPQAVQGLFAKAGTTDDSLVSFVKAGTDSTPGKYAVNVTQLATRGAAVGSLSAPLTIDNTNDTLNVTVDGKSASVTLRQQTYASAAALASEIQSQINGHATLSAAGIKVDVSQNAGVLSITSNAYGSGSKVDITGGNAALTLFGTPVETTGVDVAGSLNGRAATGRGQELTSTDGLVVKVNGGALGDRGTLTFMRGLAVELDETIGKLIDAKGTLPARMNSLQDEVKDISKQREAMEKQLEAKEARYTKQFNTLDGLLSNMQSTMSYLSQQLSALNNNK